MRMRIARFLAATGSGLALTLGVGGGGREALAQQLDVNPPLPDVLLLVDNSGSMERMIDGTNPEDSTENACDISNCIVTAGTPPTTACTVASRLAPLTTSPPANRWNNVIQALTGTPSAGFHCISMPRTSGSTFATEYEINGAAPYDTGYYLNYHRAIAIDPAGSKPCTFAPGVLPGAQAGGGVGSPPSGSVGTSAAAYPAGAIINRPYGQLTVTSSSCNFAVNNDGILDNYQDLVRFGLMTFDQDPSAATGVNNNTPPQVLSGSGAFTGMWSYFPGWNGIGTSVPATGEPIGCGAFQTFEVGSRNPDAPPWEGRMFYFPTDETQTTRDTQNVQMQAVLNATRPYGGTPMAGMFADAQYYFTTDPSGPNGSPGDVLVQGGCRKQFIVLLTDGAPNEDMRPEYLGNGVYQGGCGTQDNPATPCPYNHPEVTAAQLANPTVAGVNPVYTYVIGFALSSADNDQGMLIPNCEQIDVTTQCTNLAANSALAPCCELQKIAVAGAPLQQPGQPAPHAYFASTPGDLQAALGAIFAQIATTTTTRSVPSYSSVSNVTSSAAVPNQETFYGSFNPSPALPPPTNGTLAGLGTPWSGDVTRSRYVCADTPPTQTLSKASGDDFAYNLNTTPAQRYFIAVQAGTSGSPGNSSATLRPNAPVGGDGLGNTTVTQFPGTPSTVVGNVSAVALNLPAGNSSCPYTSDQGSGTRYLTDTQCANMLMDFTFAQPFNGPADFPFVSRVGNGFGGVYHATPVAVGPPSATLHDDSYNAFSTSTNVVPCVAGSAAAGTGTACRQNLLYAATTDGLLHAFWTDTTTNTTPNEMWAMVPPAVLPNLLSSYPASNKFLLDGTPVVKDVVFDRAQGSALSPTGTNPWHSVLVAGYGPQQVGYYAVDISTPSVPVVTGTTPGPQFLWQLTTVPATNQGLFAQHGATPAVTTVFVGNPAHEVGVAILPGGWQNPPTTPAVAGGCARATVAGHDLSELTNTAGVPTTFPYRAKVQCWGATGAAADPVVGRSVTVVRLDTGEVIATFMRKADAPMTDTLRTANLIVDTPFDSPMTGTPVVYPSDVGAIATKAFVSDQDGTIWKLDLSSTDPTQWTGKLFFDLYNTTVEPTSSTTAWSDGQPIAVPMQLALDPAGHLVIAAASGTQDQFTATGLYFVYSLSETPQTDNNGVTALRSTVNWYLSSYTSSPLLTAKAGVMQGGASAHPGERVSGPMVIFDGTLYFSTYAAPASSTLSCTAGDGFLWGRDFEKPLNPSDLSQGGVIVLSDSGKPSKDGVTNGAVIPGVSIQATTACVTLGATGNDQYVPGASHTAISSFTAGSFNLIGQVGASGANGASTISVPLAPPRTPTLINSWAAVVE